MIPASFEYSVTNWPVSAGTKASRRAGGRQKERKKRREKGREKERKKEAHCIGKKIFTANAYITTP
jgi:hypothetical protein